jgi:hypothetical protein
MGVEARESRTHPEAKRTAWFQLRQPASGFFTFRKSPEISHFLSHLARVFKKYSAILPNRRPPWQNTFVATNP